MNEITVLSSACGAMFMPGFFECLKENGERNIRVIGVDIADDPILDNFVDAYYKVSAYNDSNYIDELIDICKREKVDIFFPHISMELPIILKNIERFKEIGVQVSISESETLLIANNKLGLYDYMKSNGIATPAYFAVKTIDEFKIAAASLGYPEKAIVIKATESSGSRGIRIIRPNISKASIFLNQKPNSMDTSMEDMYEILGEFAEMPELLVMEYLPGCEYTVDLLAENGKILYMAGRRNYESSMSIAMASCIEKKEAAYALCEKLVHSLGLDGNIGFDFMLDENDEPVLTDLNPRITATVRIFKEGGLNLPYLRIKQLLGEELPEIEVQYGIKMKRRYVEMFSK